MLVRDCGTVELWKGRDESGSERTRERASGETGGRAGHQHRPGQEAARMEIRPDRFKAAAGKTLGKIHRYADIVLKRLQLPLAFARFYGFVADTLCAFGTIQLVFLTFPTRTFEL